MLAKGWAWAACVGCAVTRTVARATVERAFVQKFVSTRGAGQPTVHRARHRRSTTLATLLYGCLAPVIRCCCKLSRVVHATVPQMMPFEFQVTALYCCFSYPKRGAFQTQIVYPARLTREGKRRRPLQADCTKRVKGLPSREIINICEAAPID